MPAQAALETLLRLWKLPSKQRYSTAGFLALLCNVLLLPPQWVALRVLLYFPEKQC